MKNPSLPPSQKQPTAGLKFDAGKARFELLNWGGLWEIAEVMRDGAEKYEDRNWERGMHFGRLLGAMMRHTAAVAMGQDFDPESGHRHLAHVGACCLMLMGITVQYPELDDRSTDLTDYHTSVLGEIDEALATESDL